jgi:hypothetical protein
MSPAEAMDEPASTKTGLAYGAKAYMLKQTALEVQVSAEETPPCIIWDRSAREFGARVRTRVDSRR